jgi:non-ribosomal peptide synthetase component F
MPIQIAALETATSRRQPILDLPLDYRHVPGQPPHPLVEFSFVLTRDLTRRLTALAEQESVPLLAACLAPYAILLSRYGNTQEVNIGVLSNVRRRPKLVKVLDGHGSVSVVRISCQPDLRLRGLLQAVATSVAPGAPLGPKTAQTEGAASSCAGFLWENLEGVDYAEPELETPSPVHERFDFLLKIQSLIDVLEMVLLYRPHQFRPDTIERMSRHFTRLLEEMVGTPDAFVVGVDMMPAEELAQILASYTGGNTDYPHACLHELFAEQVGLRPDADAVVYDAERLTYRQLDKRSNQVAHFLLDEGVCPGERVGIFMNRSPEMIVAMLGILKAGGIYVPIDIEYPAEQLKFIAEDTALRLVLTERSISVSFPSSAPLVYLGTPDSVIRECSQEAVTNRSTPESIAVVNYTSGSTGQPKAACIPHRAAVRMVRNTNFIQILPDDRIAQAGSPSFDAAIMEIWLGLANGATLVGMRRETLLSPVELGHVLRSDKINILVLNTAYVHQIARDAPEALKGVRKVLFGGETAEPGPLRQLLEHVGPGVLINRSRRRLRDCNLSRNREHSGERGNRPHWTSGEQYPNLSAGSTRSNSAHWCTGRNLHWRRRNRTRLSKSARVDGTTLPSGYILREARPATLPDRRFCPDAR